MNILFLSVLLFLFNYKTGYKNGSMDSSEGLKKEERFAQLSFPILLPIIGCTDRSL